MASKPKVKVRNTKSNHQKGQKIKKQKQQDYVILDGNVYKANTNTQRLQVNYYVNRIKREAIYEKNTNIQNNRKQKPIQFELKHNNNQQSIKVSKSSNITVDMQQMIKNMTMEHKITLMKQLQKQLGNNPQFISSASSSLQNHKQHQIQVQLQKQKEKESQEKYTLLNNKLNNLQSQLENKRQYQIQKINKLFYDGQLTASERKHKITGIDKMKEKKKKIINCTRSLFYTLLYNKFEPQFYKGSHIDQAMKQLDSFSDFDNVTSQRSLPKTKKQHNFLQNNNNLHINLINKYQAQQNYHISNNYHINENKKHIIHIKSQNSQSSMQSQMQIELSVSKSYNNINSNTINSNGYNYQKYQHQSQFIYQIQDKIDSSKQINNQQLLISPDKNYQIENQKHKQKQKQKQTQKVQQTNNLSNNEQIQTIQMQGNDDKFQCSQQSLPRRLKIPLLLTRQRIQQMQWQKKAKSIQTMKIQIDRKIAFQMSQLQLQQLPTHFTTLNDINVYIVGLYEYFIKIDLQGILERINYSYGKEITEKLYCLQKNGQIQQSQPYKVLDQTYFNDYNNQISQKIRVLKDQQKIHNRAIFDCFNTLVNMFRPYYDIQGDVYPWIISEKGLTFYQINQQNIQEVFQKTKIRVLQLCATLCGIIPLNINAEQCPQLLKQKNNQHHQKQQKISFIQQYGKWNIKLIDYQTMVRLLITEEILYQEIIACSKQLHDLDQY